MKKLIYIALLTGILSACTKSGILYEQTGEISFHPVAAKTTKAAVTGTEYPTDLNFRIWSWWGDVTAGTPINDFPTYADMYINKGEFTKKTENSNWSGVTPYYWPTKGSLMFAGYSPAGAKAMNISYSWVNKTMTINTYEQSADISKTDDLMWFDVTDRSHIDNTNSKDANGVPVVFKHLLSWLTFRFHMKEGASSAYIVTKVTLKNIETEANFTSKPAAENQEWTDHYLTRDIVIWSGTEAAGIEQPITLEDSENGVIVIPQSCAVEDAQLEITYKTSESGEPQTKTVYLTAGADGHIWKTGKHYTYTMTFGSDEILVLPEVYDWDTVSVDIEVQ